MDRGGAKPKIIMETKKTMVYDKTGLTDRQTQRVDYLIKNKGYNRAKARALADQFRKKTAAAPNPATPQSASPVDPETGGVDFNEALQLIKTDTSKEAFQKAYDANYALATKGMDQQKALELEQQKQELANRGIPYDPSNADSLYGRTVQGINTRFDQLQQDAVNQSTMLANDTAATQAGIDDTNAKNTLALLGLTSDAAGRIRDSKTNVLLTREEIAARKKMNQANIDAANRNRGGGGGGGGGNDAASPVIGGDAPGWNLG